MNLKDLRQSFGTDEQCLEFIFRTKYPDLTGFYPIKGRKAYSDSKGRQIYPLKGTIFERTRVPLTLWFHALFLFYVSKNGVSAAELARQLGVDKDTAWRMGMKIRGAMKEDLTLSGIVEIDETYYGGVHKQAEKYKKKKVLLGMVERGGRAKVQVIPYRATETILPRVQENVEKGSVIMTDEFQSYKKLPKLGYSHHYTKHGKGHYVRGEVHSNTLEGLWGHLKPNLKSTHRHVRYLQAYVDEMTWRYNRRNRSAFPELLDRAVSPA